MKSTDYTLRYSKKAKFLQLRLSIKGLEVVLPLHRTFKTEDIEGFIQKKQAWINKYSSRCLIKKSNIAPPNSIDLPAIQQKWEVIYLPTQQNRLSLKTNPSKQVVLMGNTKDTSLCLKALRKWLISIAKQSLAEMLHSVAKEIGFSFKSVSIRNTMTRWGSCSSQKNISLCCKLLFLPQPLVRHVLLHELCHTKFMNHGKDFWKLLQNFDECAKIHKKQLKEAVIPAWFVY